MTETHQKALEALVRAGRIARDRALRNGTHIAIWENGGVMSVRPRRSGKGEQVPTKRTAKNGGKL